MLPVRLCRRFSTTLKDSGSFLQQDDLQQLLERDMTPTECAEPVGSTVFRVRSTFSRIARNRCFRGTRCSDGIRIGRQPSKPSTDNPCILGCCKYTHASSVFRTKCFQRSRKPPGDPGSPTSGRPSQQVRGLRSQGPGQPSPCAGLVFTPVCRKRFCAC